MGSIRQRLAFLAILASSLAIAGAYEGHKLDWEHDPHDNTNHPTRESCWERCFQVENTEFERFREVYDDFYRMGAEARRLKNVYGVNGTTLLIDSTLAAFHNDQANLDYEDFGPAIFNYQKNLASMVAIMMGVDNLHNPFYVVQFDEAAAYSCDEFHCLDACEATKVIKGMVDTPDDDELDPLQMDATSHEDGNIEAACAMGKRYIQSTTCDATTANEMAIAILNSDIWTRAHRDARNEDWEHGKGPCYAHFDTRMPIGTHAAGWDELEKWATTAAKAFYMYDNEYTFKAAEALQECMQTRCCPVNNHAGTAAVTWWNTAITGSSCQKTSGRMGESQSTWTGHAASGGP